MIKHYILGIALLILILPNITMADNKDSAVFNKIMKDPTISKAEKKKAFIDNLIKVNPQMAQLIKMPHMKAQFEQQFETVYLMMSIGQSFSEKEKEKKPIEKMRKNISVKDAMATQMAIEMKKSEASQLKMKQRYAENKPKRKGEIIFPSPSNKATPFFTFQNKAMALAISKLSTSIPFYFSDTSNEDYCKNFGKANKTNWHMLEDLYLLSEIYENDEVFKDHRGNIINKDRLLMVNRGSSGSYYTYPNPGYRAGKTIYEGGKDIGKEFYPICVADLVKVKKAWAPKTQKLDEGNPLPIGKFAKVEIGEIYLGMKLTVTDDGLIENFKWNAKIFEGDKLHLPSDKIMLHWFDKNKIKKELEIFKLRCLLDADSALLGEFPENDKRLEILIRNDFGLKPLSFHEYNPKTKETYGYDVLLSPDNRIVQINAGKRYRKNKPTAKQFESAIERKYGLPISKDKNIYYYDERDSIFKRKEEAAKVAGKIAARKEQVKNYLRTDTYRYFDRGMNTSIHEYMEDLDEKLDDIFLISYTKNSITYSVVSGKGVMDAVDKGIKTCQTNINHYIKQLISEDNNSVIDI